MKTILFVIKPNIKVKLKLVSNTRVVEEGCQSENKWAAATQTQQNFSCICFRVAYFPMCSIQLGRKQGLYVFKLVWSLAAIGVKSSEIFEEQYWSYLLSWELCLLCCCVDQLFLCGQCLLMLLLRWLWKYRTSAAFSFSWGFFCCFGGEVVFWFCFPLLRWWSWSPLWSCQHSFRNFVLSYGCDSLLFFWLKNVEGFGDKIMVYECYRRTLFPGDRRQRVFGTLQICRWFLFLELYWVSLVLCRN